MSAEQWPRGSKRDELASVHRGIAVRGGRALRVTHSILRVRQGIRYVCTCSLGGQTVEIRSDSPAIVEPGDRLLVAGKVRAGLLASLVAANLEHGVTYERANPRRLTALGAGFVLVACVACVTTVSDARWAPEAPLWWTLFPLAVASLLSLGLLGAGAYLLHLARAIRRAAALVSDTELRARVATDGAVGGCRGGRRTLPHV